MGDTLNPCRCSRPRKCVKLLGKFSSSPGLLGMVSTCTHKMSQFHTSHFQEPAFSPGPCNFKTLEIYLYFILSIFTSREPVSNLLWGGVLYRITRKSPALFVSSMHDSPSGQAQLSGSCSQDKAEL